MSRVGPYRGDGDDILDGRALDDAGGQFEFEDCFRVLPESAEIGGAELLTRDAVAGREGVLVGELTTQIRDSAALGGIQVEFEPLMAETVVVDLEAPLDLAIFVAKLTGA